LTVQSSAGKLTYLPAFILHQVSCYQLICVRLAQTPTADFIVCPHPKIEKLHIATGGSAHAWKFLPIIGDLILDSIEGKLQAELTEKWRWGRSGGDGGNAPRMDGEAKELRDVIRSDLRA
jgi:sarcosine oxidase/L-pipecolate oxidase